MRYLFLKLKFQLIAILAVFFMSSCAFHSGCMTGNAAISDGNFTVAGLASGTASTVHIFGIGGLGKDAIVLEAKRNLYTAYPLKKGQAFANVTVDFKRGYYILFKKTICTITADIIVFDSTPNQDDFSDMNAEVSRKKIKSKLGFELGETVYYHSASGTSTLEKCVITGLTEPKAQIRIVGSNGSMTHFNTKIENLFKFKKDSTKPSADRIYELNDSVFFKSSPNFIMAKGEIIGLGVNDVVISYQKSTGKQLNIINKQDIRTMASFRLEDLKNSLHGDWVLYEINEVKINNTVKAPTLTINARELRFFGHGGCNNYFGSFTMEQQGILTGPIGSTRKACNNDNIEDDFFKAFGNQSLKIKKYGSTLSLEGANNTLVFKLIYK